MRKILIIIPYFAVFLLTGCTVHQLDIQQGNVVTKEMADQLTIGMTKRQVHFLMGTPLLQAPFNPDRWDYLYVFDPGKFRAATEMRRITLFFEDERLVKMETRFPEEEETGGG